MIYIDDLILSSHNGRIEMIDSRRGSIMLSEFEMDALHHYFPAVGIRWYRGGIAEIPPCPFKLTVTEKNVVVLELEKCEFEPPKEMVMVANDGEMIQVYFEGITATIDK